MQDIHPDFFSALINQGFIVDENKNEYDSLVSRLKQEATDGKCIHITINPTLDCNLRCWYCYESHLGNTYMNDSTLNAVISLIDHILNSDVERIVLSFFGGEPLLYYWEIIRPIILESQNKSRQCNKSIDYYMTTNATLLSDDIIDDLVSNNIRMDFQVAFDGDRTNHNKTKFFKDKQGSYDIIRHNISNAINKNFPVLIRCNYTHENIISFKNLADDFQNICSSNNLEVKFHKVWQEKDTDTLYKNLLEVKAYFHEKDYNVCDNIGNKGICYAENIYNFVVNYDALIYKCTARNFTQSNSVGKLCTDGTIHYNNNYNKWIDSKYKSNDCATCIIFPICMQTCTQNIIDANNKSTCMANNTNKAIDTIIRSRISDLLCRK